MIAKRYFFPPTLSNVIHKLRIYLPRCLILNPLKIKSVLFICSLLLLSERKDDTHTIMQIHSRQFVSRRPTCGLNMWPWYMGSLSRASDSELLTLSSWLSALDSQLFNLSSWLWALNSQLLTLSSSIWAPDSQLWNSELLTLSSWLWVPDSELLTLSSWLLSS